MAQAQAYALTASKNVPADGFICPAYALYECLISVGERRSSDERRRNCNRQPELLTPQVKFTAMICYLRLVGILPLAGRPEHRAVELTNGR